MFTDVRISHFICTHKHSNSYRRIADRQHFVTTPCTFGRLHMQDLPRLGDAKALSGMNYNSHHVWQLFSVLVWPSPLPPPLSTLSPSLSASAGLGGCLTFTHSLISLTFIHSSRGIANKHKRTASRCLPI